MVYFNENITYYYCKALTKAHDENCVIYGLDNIDPKPQGHKYNHEM